MKKSKRVLSLILACVLVLTFLPTSVWATSEIFQSQQIIASNGWYHLAIKSDCSLWIWGQSSGNAAYTNNQIPFDETPSKIMDDVLTVVISTTATGSRYGFAVKKDGSLWAWGYSDKLKINSDNTSDGFIKVMDGVKHVAIGEGRWDGYIMVIKSDGSLWMWGDNRYGQLGDGTTTDRTTPFKVMDDVVAVSAGYGHSIDEQETTTTTEPQTPPVSKDMPFADVAPADWFYDDVQFVYSNSYMNAVSEDGKLFNPNGLLTRAMVVTVLYRISDYPSYEGINPFSDVPDNAWYTNAVKWAVANDIIKG